MKTIIKGMTIINMTITVKIKYVTIKSHIINGVKIKGIIIRIENKEYNS